MKTYIKKNKLKIGEQGVDGREESVKIAKKGY